MRARTRRVLRIVRNAALVAVSLIALLVGGVHVLLASAAGRDDIRVRLLPVLSEALGGKLVIEHLDTLSLFHVRARGVSLRAPSGELLASIARVDAMLSPWEIVGG